MSTQLLERIPNDPDPDEAPSVLTIERVNAIKAKPMAQWNDTERDYMREATEYASLLLQAHPSGHHTTEAFVNAIVDLGVPTLMELGRTTTVIDLRDYIDDEWLPADEAPSDRFSHIDGLPGISAKCWADKWDAELNDYVVCNATASNELGTCAEHELGGNNG